MNPKPSDVFLSEEDLDLQNLSDEELVAVYKAWLRAASITDEDDQHLYSHGVFLTEPGYSHLSPISIRKPPSLITDH
jgi:hypothetical protein